MLSNLSIVFLLGCSFILQGCSNSEPEDNTGAPVVQASNVVVCPDGFAPLTEEECAALAVMPSTDSAEPTAEAADSNPAVDSEGTCSAVEGYESLIGNATCNYEGRIAEDVELVHPYGCQIDVVTDPNGAESHSYISYNKNIDGVFNAAADDALAFHLICKRTTPAEAPAPEAPAPEAPAPEAEAVEPVPDVDEDILLL